MNETVYEYAIHHFLSSITAILLYTSLKRSQGKISFQNAVNSETSVLVLFNVNIYQNIY